MSDFGIEVKNKNDDIIYRTLDNVLVPIAVIKQHSLKINTPEYHRVPELYGIDESELIFVGWPTQTVIPKSYETGKIHGISYSNVNSGNNVVYTTDIWSGHLAFLFRAYYHPHYAIGSDYVQIWLNSTDHMYTYPKHNDDVKYEDMAKDFQDWIWPKILVFRIR